MWDIETTKTVLQAATLIAVVAGLVLTIRQLRLLRLGYEDLHDWNRRKAAQDAVGDMVPRVGNDTPLLDEKFHILSQNDPLALDSILNAIDEDKKVRLAIHKRLNYFETLAGGVHQGVFDEEVIKNAYQEVFRGTVSQFRSYIDHLRNKGFTDAYSDLEGMSARWTNRIRKNHQETKRAHLTLQLEIPNQREADRSSASIYRNSEKGSFFGSLYSIFCIRASSQR